MPRQTRSTITPANSSESGGSPMTEDKAPDNVSELSSASAGAPADEPSQVTPSDDVPSVATDIKTGAAEEGPDALQTDPEQGRQPTGEDAVVNPDDVDTDPDVGAPYDMDVPYELGDHVEDSDDLFGLGDPYAPPTPPTIVELFDVPKPVIPDWSEHWGMFAIIGVFAKNTAILVRSVVEQMDLLDIQDTFGRGDEEYPGAYRTSPLPVGTPTPDPKDGINALVSERILKLIDATPFPEDLPEEEFWFQAPFAAIAWRDPCDPGHDQNRIAAWGFGYGKGNCELPCQVPLLDNYTGTVLEHVARFREEFFWTPNWVVCNDEFWADQANVAPMIRLSTPKDRTLFLLYLLFLSISYVIYLQQSTTA